MGETISSIRPSFNQSIQIEGRSEKLTAETGAFLLREADERLGLIFPGGGVFIVEERLPYRDFQLLFIL